MTIENSVDKMISEMHQLQSKYGPYYDTWLKHYTKSVKGHCKDIAKHYKQQTWLEGMQAFLKRERKRRKEVT